MATPNKLVNFNLVEEPIRMEVSAISQVNLQYLPMILYGVGDPIQNVEKYRAQLKLAGMDKVLEEVQRQLRVYAEEYNIN